MKEIKAIVQPFRVVRIVDALQEIPGLPGVTVSEVRGFGRSRGAGAAGAVQEGEVSYVKKAKLEIVVPDRLVEEVLRVIQQQARTGNPGDGKIFVRTVDDVLRIRTGERGEPAI